MNRNAFVHCMKPFFSLIVIPLLALLISCTGSVIETTKHTNVVRVFWHELSSYSILVKNGNELKTIPLPSRQCAAINGLRGEGVRIFADVPRDADMWVTVDIPSGETCFLALTIHVHSELDINGGGWNHGKHGSGQTTVIGK